MYELYRRNIYKQTHNRKKKNQMHTIIYAKRTCQRCAQQEIQQSNRLIADAATALQIQIQDAR